MEIFVILSTIGLYLSVFVSAQRAPPGVPPQHYQPPQQQYVQQQQYQQVPVQHVPVQQHQVPVQQVPVQQAPVQQVPVQQVPVQQVPVQQASPPQHQQGHHHGQPTQILNTANIAHEKEHIAEHMEVPIDTSKMSEQELQFHYFKMHDADNNNKLDGCELIKSLIHWHGPDDQEPKPLSDEAIAQAVDQIVNLADKNKDGLIDYSEYRLAVYS